MLATVEGIRRVTRTTDGEVTATAMLERFGFTGDRLTARLGDLSGGERRRFQLLRLLLTEPNVLLLDEPTNDLDIETLNVLEDFLDGWPGTLVVVSHDRYFLERVTDSVWALLGDGQISMLPGGVDEYLARRAAVARRATGRSSDRGRRGRPRRRRRRGQGAGRQCRASAPPARPMVASPARASSCARLADRRRRLAAPAELAPHAAMDYERLALPSALSPPRLPRPEKRTRSSRRALEAAEPALAAPRPRCWARGRSTAPGPRGERRQQRPQQSGQPAPVPLGRGRRAARARPRPVRRRRRRRRACPSGVSRTSTPRRSSGSGLRSTKPRAASRSTRLVIVPLVTMVSLQQPPGRQLVRRPGPAQRGQHVELPRLDVVGRERRPADPVDVTRKPGDPAEHLDRSQVEVGALARARPRPSSSTSSRMEPG